MKTHKTSLRNTRKTPSPLERVGVRLLFLLFPLWGTGGFSQNTYIDPTVTAAMILYSENLKAKQNEVIQETSKLKQCHVLKKVYTFYINTKIRLQFKYNPKIDLQSPFFCNNFSIYNLPF